MDYTIFNDISEIPEEGNFKVVTADKEDSLVFNVFTFKDGEKCDDEVSIGPADVDIDPLGQISPTDIVWVEREAEGLFESAEVISEIFNETNGDLLSIAEKLEEQYLDTVEELEDRDDMSCLDSLDDLEDNEEDDDLSNEFLEY